MSLAIVHSRAQVGLDAPAVTVEVHLSNGIPGLTIVGLPETAVKESKDRVRCALLNSQFEFPHRRITVNLAPADLPKEGSRFDLPIALGILAASEQLHCENWDRYEFVGELALNGTLRPVFGALPLALAAKEAKRALVLPIDNAPLAALAKNEALYPAESLLAVCAHLQKQNSLPAFSMQTASTISEIAYDLSEVKGQYQAKRALEIAAAGGHNLLFIGPPGTGKTLLANCLPSILPPLNDEQAIEVASIASLCGKQPRLSQLYARPFCHPHHSASAIALVGGGSYPKPGEISRAHHGVLFLDELPEFDRKVLEVLREPLESGTITISRAAHQAQFPAQFQLICAMNPCPCGYLGSAIKDCRCSMTQLQRYRHKISGPLIDRIDLQVEVPFLPLKELKNLKSRENSQTVQKRVIQAALKQNQRQGCLNHRLSGKLLNKHCLLADNAQNLLNVAAEKFKLSARSYHRILKVARTIADLAQCEHIEASHLSEALCYRKLEQMEQALT